MRFPRWGWVALASFVLSFTLAAGQVPAAESPKQPLHVIHVDNGPNSAKAQNRHYVVLVSLDGFGWDWAKRDGAKNLLALGKQGVSAPDGMLPSYPSLTFPNHITIVTGLYPEHHGVVANNFYDPDRKASFALFDRKAVTDGTWYSGTPLWSLAESQGMRTASLFWPGSEAKIAGYLPTYYLKFDNNIDQDARIDQVLAWLKLPEADRPHFITMYFATPDREGHKFGPDAPETKAAVLKMDGMVGKLKAGLDATGLPIDLVVVSDHGMAKVEDGWVTLDKFADLNGFEAAGTLLYTDTEGKRARLYNQLKKASPDFIAYRRKDVPPELNYNQNPREGDPVLVATGPYAIRVRTPPAGKPDEPPIPGIHGFDPVKVPQMKAIFFAAGPDIVEGGTVAPFENVNLYPWLAHLLSLTAPKTDGSLNVLAKTLRDNGNDPGN
jgi:predicted AlkP superfamily pyrophosphatase or phosphodiesterase